MLMPVALSVSLWLDPFNRLQVTADVAFNDIPHWAGSSGDDFDSKLIEEADCARSHPPSKDSTSPLSVDPVGKIARTMLGERDVEHLCVHNLPIIHVDQYVVLRAPKVLFNLILQSSSATCWYRYLLFHMLSFSPIVAQDTAPG